MSTTGVGINDGVGRLLDLMKAATPEQKDLIRSTLGVGGIQKKRRKGSNSDARTFSNRFGDAVHVEDFAVCPPSNISGRHGGSRPGSAPHVRQRGPSPWSTTSPSSHQ